METEPAWLQALAGRTELLTPQEMGRADAASPGLGVASTTLMANAGRAVARVVRARFRPCRTVVLCGPGNNGGDGYIAARMLAQSGWPMAVASLSGQRPGSDAEWAAKQWRGPWVSFTPAEVARADLIIDAIFGAGLARDVDGLAANVLRASPRVVAVDVPSGVDGATGAIRGFAPHARLTLTFFRLKPGHLLLPGRDHCGALILADIGLPVRALERAQAQTFANHPSLWQLPRPAAQAHKYSRGHVTVLGGATMTGAARLAADAARRVGAGMVTIATQEGGNVYRAGSPGLLVNEAPLADLLEDRRRQDWVCGPGLGVEAARSCMPALIAAQRTVVADADVFSAFGGEPDALRGVTVLTPHAAEFARVFGRAPDRLAAAREAAARTGAVVLLKGSDTIIAAPDGRASINACAPPWLATAGAGDVLAGMIAGLLGQGMPPWEAASAAAYLHGKAAFIAGPGLIVEDLLVALHRVVSETTSRATTKERADE